MSSDDDTNVRNCINVQTYQYIYIFIRIHTYIYVRDAPRVTCANHISFASRRREADVGPAPSRAKSKVTFSSVRIRDFRYYSPRLENLLREMFKSFSQVYTHRISRRSSHARSCARRRLHIVSCTRVRRVYIVLLACACAYGLFSMSPRCVHTHTRAHAHIRRYGLNASEVTLASASYILSKSRIANDGNDEIRSYSSSSLSRVFFRRNLFIYFSIYKKRVTKD